MDRLYLRIFLFFDNPTFSQFVRNLHFNFRYSNLVSRRLPYLGRAFHGVYHSNHTLYEGGKKKDRITNMIY